MVKKIMLLLIILFCVKSEIQIVKTNEYYDTINFEKFVLGLIHQKFCYYSRKAYGLIESLSLSKKFNKLNIKIVVLDLAKNEDFKNAEKVEDIPIIYFYYKGVRIKYPLKNFKVKDLLKFLIQKKNNPYIKTIKNETEFNNFQTENGYFLTTIKKNKHKLKLFKSGFLKHSKEKFYKLYNEDLIKKLNLEQESIYFIIKNKPIIKYTKSFNHEVYEKWIGYLIYFNIIKIKTEDDLNKFSLEYNDSLFITYKNDEEENQLENKIYNFLDILISKLGIYFCNLNNEFCKKAIEKLNLNSNEGLYILKYDNRILHPLIFNLKVNNFFEDNIKESILKYFNKELDYFEISEENLNKNIHLKNPNLYKVTRKTFPEYFAYLNNHDFVILFTFSDPNDRVKKINDIYSDVTSNFQDKEHKIIFSYFFLNLNNHEFIDAKNIGTPFIRIYSYGNLKNFVDFSFLDKSLKNIDVKIRNFLYDNCNETITKNDL